MAMSAFHETKTLVGAASIHALLDAVEAASQPSTSQPLTRSSSSRVGRRAGKSLPRCPRTRLLTACRVTPILSDRSSSRGTRVIKRYGHVTAINGADFELSEAGARGNR